MAGRCGRKQSYSNSRFRWCETSGPRTECQGKNIGKTNETTPHKQALSEARSLWDKKVKSGYSNRMSAPQTTYHPMLAQEMTDKLVQYPCFVQPKLDGIRCIVYKTDQIHFQSRNHSMLQTMTHLLPDLEQIFHMHPNAVLDGELYTHGMGFQKITSLVRKKIIRNYPKFIIVYTTSSKTTSIPIAFNA